MSVGGAGSSILDVLLFRIKMVGSGDLLSLESFVFIGIGDWNLSLASGDLSLGRGIDLARRLCESNLRIEGFNSSSS